MQSKFEVKDIFIFKQKVLSWLKQFNTFCFLDSNGYPGKYDLLVGAGIEDSVESSGERALLQLQNLIDANADWLFGHICYETITSEKIDHREKEDPLVFPSVYFFKPKVVLCLRNDTLEITCNNPETVFSSIQQMAWQEEGASPKIEMHNRISKEDYISAIEQLQRHIYRGDCYEINFCQEFFSENVTLDPISLFSRFNKISPNPFSGLYKLNNQWLLCASPERFIKKDGGKVFSQPIKGTLLRNRNLNNIDAEREQLLNSEKDKAENVMIVDLVRNDLSKICEEGTVKVDELFGIYSFPHLHQMISTISGKLKETVNFKDIINACFPMGSMTGAPKIKVMQLIDRYEKSKRGIYSGTLGYISPAGDFDLNVIIRSIMYNQSNKYLSYQVGGGITAYSNAEKEWEECMVKATAIKELLGN